MKMFLGEIPIQALNVHHFEMDTNDATMVASDLQAGVTCYARGQKVTGTGKSFEFAYYGAIETNRAIYIPNNINVIEIASLVYPIQLSIALTEMENVDFSIEQVVGSVVVDGATYEVAVQAANNFLTVSCEVDFDLQVFYGKDNYI